MIRQSDANLNAFEVRLAHASVKEFLLAGGSRFDLMSKSPFDARMVHEKLAHTCVAYLLYLGSSNLEEASIPRKFPLVDYAAKNWMVHAKEADESSGICRAAMKLLRRNELCYERLLRFHDIDRPWRTIRTKTYLPGNRRAYAASQVSPLYYASLVGLTSVVRLLLRDTEDINESCGFFSDALSAAAAQGHEDVVSILLQNGAEAGSQRGFQRCALIAAATAGHVSIMELLLAAGADSNLSHYRRGDALLVAIRNAHEGAVRLLIKRGVDVGRGVGKNQCPIDAAVSYGQATIVQILLEAGAIFNSRTLELAAQKSHEPLIEILRGHLTRSQEFNGASFPGGKATSGSSQDFLIAAISEGQAQQNPISLASAAMGGLRESVQQLLDSGIDVNTWKTKDQGTALSIAAGNGHLSVVQLLLQRHADINLQPKCSMLSPIDAAARHGHLSVVRELLRAQPLASFAVRVDTYGNPLKSAAYSGNLAAFREILSLGPDVNTICKDGGTALAAATAVGHETMVQLLIGGGVDVNLIPFGRSGHGCWKLTPLASAAFGGHIEVAGLLLVAGADIEMTSGWNGWTPLAIAVSEKQTPMVEFLLNASGSQAPDSSAVEVAVSGTPEDHTLLRLLLNRYAKISNSDLNTQNPSSTSAPSLAEYLTPALFRAITLNRQSAVKVLLQYGADVNAQDGRGYTSLHQAAQCDKKEIAMMLTQDYHADIYAKLLNGSLPNCTAAQYGSNECVKFFLSQNVDVDVLNHEFHTPLHTALDNGREDTVRLSIAKGARLDLADQDGITALDVAEYNLAEQRKQSHFWASRKTLPEIIVEEAKKRSTGS